jgi:hypothetical protein
MVSVQRRRRHCSRRRDRPLDFQNTTQIQPWVGKKDYDLITDMADQAIDHMNRSNAAAPAVEGRGALLLLGTGSTQANLRELQRLSLWQRRVYFRRGGAMPNLCRHVFLRRESLCRAHDQRLNPQKKEKAQ